MPRFDRSARMKLPWLADLGLDDADFGALNPCVPGEFTLADALYVNTATPGVVYGGAEEGTLPMAAGHWYMLPSRLSDRNPALRAHLVSVSRAARSLRV